VARLLYKLVSCSLVRCCRIYLQREIPISKTVIPDDVETLRESMERLISASSRERRINLYISQVGNATARVPIDVALATISFARAMFERVSKRARAGSSLLRKTQDSRQDERPDNRHAKHDFSITKLGTFSHLWNCFGPVSFSFSIRPIPSLSRTRQVALIAGSHDMSPLLKTFVKGRQRG